MISSLTLAFPSSSGQSSTPSNLAIDHSSLGGVQQRTGLFALAVAFSVSWLEDKGTPSAVAIRESNVHEG
ncbi:hypothetical protein ARMGADRAFT_1079118 [Armillaria gallica]|uniref:Uncharacterized protein n=1 Tax=Armillaria gallica TaxID=47427 RepID=A0A2H3DZC5_ARMGA|nr:hypothetical protein ARMGADRAFT_1079118 [Armillaria gallica]